MKKKEEKKSKGITENKKTSKRFSIVNIIAIVLTCILTILTLWITKNHWLILYQNIKYFGITIYDVKQIIVSVTIVILQVCVSYSYFVYLFMQYKNKKWVKAGVLTGLIILAVLAICYVRWIANNVLREVLLEIGVVIYITVLLGGTAYLVIRKIIKRYKNYKKDEKIDSLKNITIMSLLTIVLACMIVALVIFYITVASMCVGHTIRMLDTYSISYLFTSRQQIAEKEKIEKLQKANKLFLDYLNKQEKKGYLDKLDIVNGILTNAYNYRNIQDLTIAYQDTQNQIAFEKKVSEKGFKEAIEEKMEGTYFKVYYNYDDEQNLTKITIKRIVANFSSPEEKNSDISFAKGAKLNRDMIQEKEKRNGEEESDSYLYEYTLKGQENSNNTEDFQFKMRICYDKEKDNYIMVDGDTDNYSKIKGYKIYSSGIDIILNGDVTLTNKYYTMRLNRYDEKLDISDGYNYYYIFEPVVTTLTDSEGNTVLEMKFPQTFMRKQIKNIEILFGYME
ncbi:MAG: hypothetical protein ACLU8F_06095 [Clostridia bacterium]